MLRFDPDPPLALSAGRGLLPWLVLALLLHAILLSLLRPPAGGSALRPSGLELFLVPPRSPEPAAASETAPPEPAAPRPRSATKAAAATGRPELPAPPAALPPEAAADSAIPSAGVTGGLIESVRQQIRHESRQRAQSLPMGPVLAAVTPGAVDNPLARALKAPAAGERHFADGLMKITQPDGSVYCVLKPRDFQRSDFDSVVATMTCP